MKTTADFYVYCYIDPRNLQEFYYGKGTGGRSKAHLLAQGGADTAVRIRGIKKDGAEPIIRIIATGLTEEQALWTKAALLWRLGETLTNIKGGLDAGKFRRQNTLHTNLVGFDFSARIHFFNVGEYWNQRSWDDCQKYGFLSAGHGKKYADAARQLHENDIVLPYISKHGYVGIGRVLAEAVPAREFRIADKTLHQMQLQAPDITHDSADLQKCEYVVRVEWLCSKKREDALWRRGLFHSLQTHASMANQQNTLSYIEQEWRVRFADILEKSES